MTSQNSHQSKHQGVTNIALCLCVGAGVGVEVEMCTCADGLEVGKSHHPKMMITGTIDNIRTSLGLSFLMCQVNRVDKGYH